MTVPTELTKIVYETNGSTKNWSFSFPGGPDPDIKLFVQPAGGDIVQVTTNLQVNLNPPIDPNPTSIGGSVIYPVTGAPLAIGAKVIIMRDVPEIQPTSLVNQGTLYPQVIEETFDYLEMQIQQLQEQIDRSLLAPITDTGGAITFPPCPQRANKFLAFDENCEPIAVGNANPITSTNGIRVPNTETIPALGDKTTRPGTVISFDNNGDPILIAIPPPNVFPLLGARVNISGTHTVTNDETGFLFQLGGNIFYDFILGDPTTYDPNFSVAVFNGDIYTGPGSGRAKRVMFNGTIMPGGLLWPGQWLYIFRYGSTWVANPRDIRWKPGIPVTFFVDPVAGHDDGTSDGLATGAGASKTVNAAVAVAMDRVDYGGILVGNAATIQLAPGTYTESVMINFPTVGGEPLTIKGSDDGVPPTNVLFNTTTGVPCIRVDNSATVNIKGVRFNGIGNDCQGVVAAHGATINMNNCEFDNFPGANFGCMVWAIAGAVINMRDITIAGGCQFPFVAFRNASIRMSGALTVSAGLPFTYFLIARYYSSITGGAAALGDPTDFHLVGGAGCTGSRYAIQWNSLVDLGAGVADTLPGNAAGVTGGSGPLHGTDNSTVW